MDGSLKDLDRALASVQELEEAVRPLGRQGDTGEIRDAIKALKKARDAAMRTFEALADKESSHHELLSKAGALHDGACAKMDSVVVGLDESLSSVRRLERAASEGLPGRFRLGRTIGIPSIRKTLAVAKEQVSRALNGARASMERARANRPALR